MTAISAVDLHRRSVSLALYALYPPTRHLAVKVRLFIDLLVERFGRNPL
jgi:DNA-binding transcriptional LysR family regulator